MVLVPVGIIKHQTLISHLGHLNLQSLIEILTIKVLGRTLSGELKYKNAGDDYKLICNM